MVIYASISSPICPRVLKNTTRPSRLTLRVLVIFRLAANLLAPALEPHQLPSQVPTVHRDMDLPFNDNTLLFNYTHDNHTVNLAHVRDIGGIRSKVNMSDTIDVSQIGSDETQGQSEHNTRKRRRSLRKGTHSCWACKRRKEKCTFEDGDVCNGCLRRGTNCVSQLFADDDAQATSASASANATASRLQRIEDMVARLASQVQIASQNHVQGQIFTPPLTARSHSPAPQAALSQAATSAPTIESNFPTPVASRNVITTNISLTKTTRLQVLSQTLRTSLPCPQDIQLLRNATARLPVLSNIHVTKSYHSLRRDGIHPTDGVLPEPPLSTSDPIRLAKYMLQLAIFLQEMPSVVYTEIACLTEPAAVILERCATTAIDLVTRQDDLLGSIESLESVVLESFYQCNSGRLRLSWMAVQRAIVLAQTMGLHLVRGHSASHPQNTLHPPRASQTCVDLRHLWFRIIHYDLQLSRMLGLPPRLADVAREKSKSSRSSFDAATDTPESYLERVYSEVMILALAHRSSDPSPPDAQAIQALEQELQKAANVIPSHWWLPPNLTESSKSPVKLFWDMRRLVTQMLHHDLRSQLNVPCMLARGEGDKQRSEMARMACVHSSREVLSRFILLQDFTQSVFSCRFANFLGLMAAITLVLAHLGGSSRRSQDQTQDPISAQVDSLLAHQAPSDRAMMEQALEAMRSMNYSSGDALSEQSANVLHRLLDIQMKNNLYMAEGNAYVSVQAQSANTAAANNTTEEGEPMFIPYFGVMRIVRPQSNDVTRDVSATTAFNAGNAAQSGNVAGHADVDLIDPLLLDLRDEHWMSQTIDMTFLDAFLDGTI
jgi:hypothetical protein